MVAWMLRTVLAIFSSRFYHSMTTLGVLHNNGYILLFEWSAFYATSTLSWGEGNTSEERGTAIVR